MGLPVAKPNSRFGISFLTSNMVDMDRHPSHLLTFYFLLRRETHWRWRELRQTEGESFTYFPLLPPAGGAKPPSAPPPFRGRFPPPGDVWPHTPPLPPGPRPFHRRRGAGGPGHG